MSLCFCRVRVILLKPFWPFQTKNARRKMNPWAELRLWLLLYFNAIRMEWMRKWLVAWTVWTKGSLLWSRMYFQEEVRKQYKIQFIGLM